MGLLDASLKVLFHKRPQELLCLLPSFDPSWKVKPLPTELPLSPPLPRAIDGCAEVEVEGEGEFIYHLEYEAEPHSNTGMRLFEHTAMLHVQRRCPVRPVVVYLTPGNEGRKPQAHHSWSVAGQQICRLDFEIICLWKESPQTLLARPSPALWALVALAGGVREADVRLAFEKIQQEVEPREERESVLAVLYWLAGTRFEAEDLNRLLPKEVLMYSTTYEATLKEGLEKGLEKGREEGRAQGRAQGREEGREAGREEGRVAVLRETCLALLRAKEVVTADVAGLERLGPADLEALRDELIGAVSSTAARAALERWTATH